MGVTLSGRRAAFRCLLLRASPTSGMLSQSSSLTSERARLEVRRGEGEGEGEGEGKGEGREGEGKGEGREGEGKGEGVSE